MSEELSYIRNRLQLDLNGALPIFAAVKLHRVELAKIFAELGYMIGAEIGTASGGYASVLCRENRNATLYCVDPWEIYPEYLDYITKERMDRNYDKAVERLKHYKNVQFIRKYSMDALELFEDGSLDFVYIDANHCLPYVLDDIAGWSKKVRKGGIVSGHDYLIPPCVNEDVHVKQAVKEYTKATNIKPWFVIGEKERALSWLWIK